MKGITYLRLETKLKKFAFCLRMLGGIILKENKKIPSEMKVAPRYTLCTQVFRDNASIMFISGRGEDFLSRQPKFFTETAVTPEQKVKKWFPTWEINRHAEG